MLKGIGTTELLVIAVIVMVFFGGKAFSSFAKNMGKSTKEIKKVKKEAEEALSGTPLENKKSKTSEGGVN